MKMQPRGNEETGREMKPRNKYRKEIMEDAPATIKSLKGIRNIQQRFKKHKQAQAHELQFQSIMREVIT